MQNRQTAWNCLVMSTVENFPQPRATPRALSRVPLIVCVFLTFVHVYQWIQALLIIMYNIIHARNNANVGDNHLGSDEKMQNTRNSSKFTKGVYHHISVILARIGSLFIKCSFLHGNRAWRGSAAYKEMCQIACVHTQIVNLNKPLTINIVR